MSDRRIVMALAALLALAACNTVEGAKRDARIAGTAVESGARSAGSAVADGAEAAGDAISDAARDTRRAIAE
jgi:predicted small secreted protein